MFTFDAIPVKFGGLLILFAFCTVWCVYELTRPQDVRQRVSNSLHLVMAAVMLLMVPTFWWTPFIGVVTMPVVLAVFAGSTVWFVALTVVAHGSGGRHLAHYAGHAAMFAAMTWHLAAMAVKRSQMGPQLPAWMMAESTPGGVLWTFALIGVPLMTYLFVASLLDLRRVLRPRADVTDACAGGPNCACEAATEPVELHELELVLAGPGVASASAAAGGVPVGATAGCDEDRRVGTPTYRLSALADFAMNFGMFWMSTGLMTALLPFFAFLSF